MQEDLDHKLENYGTFFYTANHETVSQEINTAHWAQHILITNEFRAKMLKALVGKYSSVVLKDRVGFNLQIEKFFIVP